MRKDTLAQAIEGFFIIKAVEISPNTADIYKWALFKLCDHLQNPEIVSITHKDLQGFINYLDSKNYVPNRKNGKTDKLAPRSIENAWTAIRSFYKWCVVEYRLKKNPSAELTRPKYKLPPIIPFSEDEVIRLLKACEYTSQANPQTKKSYIMRRRTAARDIAVVSVLIDTCVRISELWPVVPPRPIDVSDQQRRKARDKWIPAVGVGR